MSYAFESGDYVRIVAAFSTWNGRIFRIEERCLSTGGSFKVPIYYIQGRWFFEAELEFCAPGD